MSVYLAVAGFEASISAAMVESMSPALLDPVGSLLRRHPDTFRDLVHEQLFVQALEARQLFPLKQAAAHRELAAALAWALEHTDRRGQMDYETLARIRRLGLSHRRLGFPVSLYEPFAAMCTAAIRELNSRQRHPLPENLMATTEEAVARLCTAMAASSHTADMSGLPPAHMAQVTEVERVSNRTTIVRLQAHPGPEYEPGQALMVTATYLPGIWRPLVPALPANPGGFLEFHVREIDGGEASHLLARPKVGDYWTVGAPRGRIELSDDATHLTILAFDTGLAVAEAYLFSLIDASHRPLTHLIVHTRYPGDHYDLDLLRRLADAADWLTVTATVEDGNDPWWLPLAGHAGTTADAVGAEIADPVELASADVSPARSFLLTGTASAVGDAYDRLVEQDVAAERIDTIDFDSRHSWPSPRPRHHRPAEG